MTSSYGVLKIRKKSEIKDSGIVPMTKGKYKGTATRVYNTHNMG